MAMGLQGISWACSPISRDHLNVLVASLQDGDNLAAEPGLLPLGRGNRSRNTSMCRLCFCSSAQQQFRTDLHSLNSLQLSGHWWLSLPHSFLTHSLSAGLWICHSRAEISAVIFWSKELYSNEQFSSGWTSRVTVAVSLLWTPVKGTLKRLQPTPKWSTGCFGIQ